MKLEELLKKINAFNWKKVPGMPYKFKSSKYIEMKKEFFKKQLEKAGIELSGSVLDLCCGSVSFGMIYDNVVGYDIKPECIKELRKNGIKGIIGDIRNMPFEDKSFDYVVCSCPPMRSSKNLTYEELCNPQSHIDNLVDDCIRIARKKVFIISSHIVRHLPNKHKEKMENKSEIFVVYKI